MEVMMLDMATNGPSSAKRLFVNTWEMMMMEEEEPSECSEEEKARLADEFRHVFIHLQVG